MKVQLQALFYLFISEYSLMKSTDILIIGGGLSGLMTAYLLEKENAGDVHILEARQRLGGRIYTLRSEGEASIEMGATWLGRNHKQLIELLKELDIEVEEQKMGSHAFYEAMSMSPPQLIDLPQNDQPSYRIAGGTDMLIRGLSERLDKTKIQLGQIVSAIKEAGNGLVVETETQNFKADIVISTLAPRLLIDSVKFSPQMPQELISIAGKTHTWMGESIKVALSFDNPFWQNSGMSGTIFSNVGPINEMYDHSGNGGYALNGFMNGAYRAATQEKRKRLVLEQMHRFYGKKADSYLTYNELVWAQEPFTFRDYSSQVIPHQNNGHPYFKETYLENRFLLAGAETATSYPGYMDGAVESARRVADRVKQLMTG